MFSPVFPKVAPSPTVGSLLRFGADSPESDHGQGADPGKTNGPYPVVFNRDTDERYEPQGSASGRAALAKPRGRKVIAGFMSLVALTVAGLFGYKAVDAYTSPEMALQHRMEENIKDIQLGAQIEQDSKDRWMPPDLSQERKDYREWMGVTRLADGNTGLPLMAAALDYANRSTELYQPANALPSINTDGTFNVKHSVTEYIPRTKTIVACDNSGWVNPIPSDAPLIGPLLGRDCPTKVVPDEPLATTHDQRIDSAKLDKVWNVLSQEDKNRLHDLAEQTAKSGDASHPEALYQEVMKILRPYFNNPELDVDKRGEYVHMAQAQTEQRNQDWQNDTLIAAGALLALALINRERIKQGATSLTSLVFRTRGHNGEADKLHLVAVQPSDQAKTSGSEDVDDAGAA